MMYHFSIHASHRLIVLPIPCLNSQILTLDG